MQQSRNKHMNSRKKQIPSLNPELTTAQMQISRGPSSKPSVQLNNPTINPQQVLIQAEQLFATNQVLECINLLKGLIEYLRGIKYTDQKIWTIVHTNLAVSYYKVGFLEQAYDEFASVVSIIKDVTISLKNFNYTNNRAGSSSLHNKLCQKLRYDMLASKIELQTCILFSEMGKHQLALDHARLSCKSCYNMIFDLQIILYQKLNAVLSSQNKNKTNYNAAYAPQQIISIDGYQNLINNIVMIDQLLSSTKDLKHQFLLMNKQKTQLLEDERVHINRIGKLPLKSDLQKVYELVPENVESLWIFKNKILDQIQMKLINQETLDFNHIYENSQAIQKVVYLAISLYCYSTETRFMQKDEENKDPCDVLDSEHWLSRSLEIAYSFMPQQAPILNQILTVHDRFHGIDKQTIPQDRQVGGFFKVLRPLSKPKSSYSSKNLMGAPIMIRIQMPKLSIQQQQDIEDSLDDKQTNKMAKNKVQYANKTIDLQLGSMTKNNKIRGLNTTKKFDFADSQTVIRRKHNTKVDFSQNLKNIYASRKMKSASEPHSHSLKSDKMKLNLTNIKDKKDQSSYKEFGGPKSMRRPHSYDRQINKPEQFYPIQTERKKKSFSLNKKQAHKRRSATSNSAGLKLDGLQVIPSSIKKIEEDDYFQINSKLSNNIQASKMGGNIFINNNINLFISKDSIQSSKNSKTNPIKQTYQISKRQNYINKRRAQNISSVGTKNPQFL